MKRIILDNDIKVLCLVATVFPEGILDAHQKLHTIVPFLKDRKYFGISRPEKGVITYRAAAEEIAAGEAERLNLDTTLIRKGTYISLDIRNFRDDLTSIEKAFKQLLLYPNLDHQGYCIEYFLNDRDVRCMIRLKNQNIWED